MPSASEFVQSATRMAKEAGFNLAGVADVSSNSFPELRYFPEWVAAGRAGEMEYLKARNEAGQLKREALNHAAPWAKSVVVCALNYNADQPHSIESTDATNGWISRYSWFKDPAEISGKALDYHDAVLRRLRKVEADLLAIIPDLQTRCYVDTGPIIERVYAKYAGIGWIGKNTCIINQEIGSWTFLGVVLTSFSLDQNDAATALNVPAADRCGSCTRCIDACPTHALEPYKMDATRCIAYLTIEKRGAIPEELREGIGRNVFGCDICQDVCPWNGAESPDRKAALTSAPEFQARPELVNPPLQWLGQMSRDEFNQTFRASPIKRAKYEGFRRNVVIAMGNSGDPAFLPLLESLSGDPDPTIAEHARWALERLTEKSAV